MRRNFSMETHVTDFLDCHCLSFPNRLIFYFYLVRFQWVVMVADLSISTHQYNSCESTALHLLRLNYVQLHFVLMHLEEFFPGLFLSFGFRSWKNLCFWSKFRFLFCRNYTISQSPEKKLFLYQFNTASWKWNKISKLCQKQDYQFQCLDWLHNTTLAWSKWSRL